MKKALTACVVSALSLVALQGCLVQSETDRFREAVPKGDEVKTGVPGASGSGKSGSTSLRIATGSGSGSAKYYEFTREITWGTDTVTGVILAAVKAVTDEQPTTLESKKAVWGPWSGSALEPVTWRFSVTEGATDEFDYVLEGKPRNGSDSEYKAVLRGKGYGKSNSAYRTGNFSVDNDAFRSLDSAHGKDDGSVKVVYDLKNLEKRNIKVELRPGGTKGKADIDVQHASGGAGTLNIVAQLDIDSSKSTKAEDITIVSRWNTAGAGRADISLQGGDVASVGVVKASECWSTSFSRVYYSDSVTSEPTTGDPAACAFTEAK